MRPSFATLAVSDEVSGLCNVYLHGYLHRDVSLGNMLCLSEEKPCKEFRVLGPLLDFPYLFDDGEAKPRKDIVTWNSLKDIFAEKHGRLELVKLGERLEKATDGLTPTCKAVVADFDLSAKLKSYFEPREHGPELSVRFFIPLLVAI